MEPVPFRHWVVARAEDDHTAMRFEGEHRYPDGRRAPYRMTFTPNEDGTVRQLIEESADGGETFAVGFDGLYKPEVVEESDPAEDPEG